MLNNQQIEKVISYLFHGKVEYEAIGNHELKRHLVYRVKSKDEDFVLKLYFVSDRWNREVGTLCKLRAASPMIPVVEKYGILDDQNIADIPIEYLIYKWQPGQLMMDIEKDIDAENLKKIYYEIGIELAKIHLHTSLGDSGILSETGNYKKLFFSNREYFLYEVHRIFNSLDKYTHEEIDLINRSKVMLMMEIEGMDWKGESVYCHNDFGPRNLLVSKANRQYKITGIIDFEQASVSDGDRETIVLYNRMKRVNKKHAEEFIKGYLSLRNIDIRKKERMYMLFNGLSICGWSKEVAPDYYNEGISILKKYINK